MKICLISFDYWDYDKHIVEALKQKGIDASHIDISNFRYEYKGIIDRVSNFFRKTFTKSNIKRIKSQEYVMEHLKKLGKQDHILCIRPDSLDLSTHQFVKKQTDHYIAYIYDSCKRFPIDHLLNGIFDDIYSFDLDDVEQYHFKHLSNYIYQEKQDLKKSFKQDVFIVMTADDRSPVLNTIASKLEALNIWFNFILVGKHEPKNLHSGITYQREEIRPDTLKTYLDDSRIFLDLIRPGHNGLSFRVFESLAYQRKLITTNKTVVQYDFYNPNNILVIDENNINLDSEFFNTPYAPLPENIYYKYTIDNWVNTVFELKS